jgi:hypothetical protein
MIFDDSIKDLLNKKLGGLEKHFTGNVIFYFGEIHPALVKSFRDFIEKLRDSKEPKDRLVVILNTPGGSAEVVEKMVEIIRFHYKEVYFVVPDYAMSAGTILCMSGNKLYMDYSSSLGPIDPQVFNGKEYVPALAYLDKVEQLLEKARQNTLTQAEFLILQNQDLATLGRYEQARDLTITLLKEWLTKYKFSTWDIHSEASDRAGEQVTAEEKQERAEEIARLLGDNKLWHSHGRMIGINTVRDRLRLKVEDYSDDSGLRGMIRSYNDLITAYIVKAGYEYFMHSKNSF